MGRKRGLVTHVPIDTSYWSTPVLYYRVLVLGTNYHITHMDLKIVLQYSEYCTCTGVQYISIFNHMQYCSSTPVLDSPECAHDTKDTDLTVLLYIYIQMAINNKQRRGMQTSTSTRCKWYDMDRWSVQVQEVEFPDIFPWSCMSI